MLPAMGNLNHRQDNHPRQERSNGIEHQSKAERNYEADQCRCLYILRFPTDVPSAKERSKPQQQSKFSKPHP